MRSSAVVVGLVSAAAYGVVPGSSSRAACGQDAERFSKKVARCPAVEVMVHVQTAAWHRCA
jgi:hypothetical protein